MDYTDGYSRGDSYNNSFSTNYDDALLRTKRAFSEANETISERRLRECGLPNARDQIDASESKTLTAADIEANWRANYRGRPKPPTREGNSVFESVRSEMKDVVNTDKSVISDGRKLDELRNEGPVSMKAVFASAGVNINKSIV